MSTKTPRAATACPGRRPFAISRMRCWSPRTATRSASPVALTALTNAVTGPLAAQVTARQFFNSSTAWPCAAALPASARPIPPTHSLDPSLIDSFPNASPHGFLVHPPPHAHPQQGGILCGRHRVLFGARELREAGYRVRLLRNDFSIESRGFIVRAYTSVAICWTLPSTLTNASIFGWPLPCVLSPSCS